MAELKLTVYSKPACGLCDEMMEVVKRVSDEVAFTVEVIDIERDPELMRKYGQEIPVLFIDGRKAAKFRISEGELRRRLRRAGARAEATGPDEALALEGSRALPPAPVRLAFVLAALAVIAGFLYRGIARAGSAEGRLAAHLLEVKDRDQAPVPFKLTALDGKEVSLSDFQGKVVFLNFWATWCPPCVDEMPSLLRLQERLKDRRDLVMLAVSVDEGWEPIKKFFGDKPPALTVLLDKDGALAKQYGTTQFPETYVLVDGRVRGFIEGPRDWDGWFADAYLDSLLGKKTPDALAARY
jgi:thiol-disulfide isomerase/thioredoxin